MKKKIKKAEDGVKTNLIGVKSQGRSEGRVNMAEREQRIKANELEGYRKAFRDNYNKNTSTISPASTTTASSAIKSNEKPKGSASSGGSKGGGSSAPKSGSTSPAKTETKSAPKPGIRMSADKLTPASTKQLEKSKPIDVSYKKPRTYSETERKINQQIEKIRKGEGSVEAAQSRILALKAKEKRAGEKAERQQNRSNRRAITKSVRAGKFNKRLIAKSAK